MRQDDGFALIDSLVAMAIISTGVILGISGMRVANHLVQTSHRIQFEDGALRFLMTATPDVEGDTHARMGSASWKVDVSEMESLVKFPRVIPCRKVASIAIDGGYKPIEIQTLRLCKQDRKQ